MVDTIYTRDVFHAPPHLQPLPRDKRDPFWTKEIRKAGFFRVEYYRCVFPIIEKEEPVWAQFISTTMGLAWTIRHARGVFQSEGYINTVHIHAWTNNNLTPKGSIVIAVLHSDYPSALLIKEKNA